MHVNKLPAINRSGMLGFTLIELMIAVAIVGILATIAIASYDFAVIKANRGAGKSCLLEVAQVYERHYLIHKTYITGPGEPTPADLACAQDNSDIYLYYIGAGSDNFIATAEPTGRQAKDTRCGKLMINQVGAKSTESGDNEYCW